VEELEYIVFLVVKRTAEEDIVGVVEHIAVGVLGGMGIVVAVVGIERGSWVQIALPIYRL